MSENKNDEKIYSHFPFGGKSFDLINSDSDHIMEFNDLSAEAFGVFCKAIDDLDKNFDMEFEGTLKIKFKKR